MNEPKALQGEALIRILHPSDFTRASLIAFAHALKIALQANAELEIVHVEPHKIGSNRGTEVENQTSTPGSQVKAAKHRQPAIKPQTLIVFVAVSNTRHLASGLRTRDRNTELALKHLG